MPTAFQPNAFQNNAFQISDQMEATLAGLGGIVANLVEFHSLAATLTGTGAIPTADLRELHRLNARLVGDGAVIADLLVIHQLSATLSGVGDLIVDEGFLRELITLVAEAVNAPTITLQGPSTIQYGPVILVAEAVNAGTTTLQPPAPGTGTLVGPQINPADVVQLKRG